MPVHYKPFNGYTWGYVPQTPSVGGSTLYLREDGTWQTPPGGGGGGGDVVGPASAVANNVVIFNGATGKLIKDSGVALSGSNTGDETTSTIKTKLGITTLSGSNTGDQTISIGGDGTAAGGTGALTLAVTKVNGVSFAGLGTGILKNTTGTGVPSIAVAADFPTLNQSTTGSAATLTTPRNINGTAFNGSADITVTVPVATGITGLGGGVATWLATPSSANLAAAVTDETGTGVLVFGTNPTINNPVITGNEYLQQGAPASLAAAATLTAAQMLGGLIQYTGAAGALTLPTGTLMDAAVVAGLAVDRAFEVCFIVTGAGAATVTAGVAFTLVGAGLVAAGTSARFRCRKTAANTYVAYRVG